MKRYAVSRGVASPPASAAGCLRAGRLVYDALEGWGLWQFLSSRRAGGSPAEVGVGGDSRGS